MITLLATSHLPHESSLNLIEYSVRKAREAYLIERGKTLESLDKKNEMSYSLYFFYLLSFIYTIFTFQISFQSLLQRFLFSTFTFSHLNVTCYNSIILHAIP